ncbi:MAG: L-glutamate gamma-semialdehyde dehydrogenase [Bacteroidetes bacterium]|nr:L-glutamate gamma-semialdehyde dehydrogenase [Bacteroidota bacterium]MBU1580494.1 L-glutamate gamma-semialdehyde dehydrogenase [Bacteroidota bacterium]MBU2465805.1 L-glutamate gamma-semialdehyde dehydrogenase [Bacteroidota bacterium]MBU2556439.1 L-glutamate gamma-semialdehyde dehydrogenase [Bacteroidota bacterium]
MYSGFYKVPKPYNETVKSYAPGSPERAEVKSMLSQMRSEEIEVPMVIGGERVTTEKKLRLAPPHDIAHTLGYYYQGDGEHVNRAIEAALKVRQQWQALEWEDRATIFLKAADLISGPYRAKINAATMLGQSKTVHQAEIDAACEFADFLRYNVHFMSQIYDQQPISDHGVWNRIEYRPLEGFIYALTPFNFTAIAGNLPSAPALMGNVVVWKPSNTQIYSAKVIMEIFEEAGLPDGVINLIFVPGPVAGKILAAHPDFVGIHYTGSTAVFSKIWKAIGDNVTVHNTYPKIVGETGGKDFVMAHETADVKALATALIRGAFEYQGQKCSAASRAYIPSNIWPEVWQLMEKDLKQVKMGPIEDFSNFMGAVIDEASFDKLSMFIDNAKQDKEATILFGGNYDKSEGYFIEPTVILTSDPHYVTMHEELFGPVLTIFVYDAKNWKETLKLVDTTTHYSLTGAVFAKDRFAIEEANIALTNAAGNYYINDKPTGAVVGQQPFGGARASGTNDKSGSYLNLLRWVSPRTIKENFNPPTDFRYPFMQES